MKLSLASGFVFFIFTVCVSADTLEKVISREDPKFDCSKAVLTVGRDGNVYLGSIVQNGAYVLRVSPDGKTRLGGDVVSALRNATANASGIIATANAHFKHSVNIYDKDFNPQAACKEFLNNDKVGWTAPARIEAGASGDFYGLDQNRNRILRLNTSGKIVQVYAFPEEVKTINFRVCEANQSFYLSARDNTLSRVGFDGKILWSQKISAVFTVDDNGNVLHIAGDKVKRLSADGKALPDLPVKIEEAAKFPVTAIGVWNASLFAKRTHNAELFQTYDIGSGKLTGSVAPAHEKISAEFPSLTWTSGQTIPFTVKSSGAPLHWRIWATAFGDSNWRELELKDGRISVPADFAGLYQLRIAPTLNPEADSEFTLREVIEVRIPDSKGTVSVWTPLNRVNWARGEAIPAGIVLRNDKSETAGQPVIVELVQMDGARTKVFTANLKMVPNTESAFSIPAETTAKLAAGRYELRAETPGFTCAAQPIRIGGNINSASPFRVTLHGDYKNSNSNANVWLFADDSDRILTRSKTLGVNQYVNRIFAGRYPLTFINSAEGKQLLADLKKRLEGNIGGVSPQKVEFGFAQAHALGAFGANGIREWLILVGMDAALPIGTSTGYAAGVKPEQYAAEISKYSKALEKLPSFQGWDWVANWWVTDKFNGAAADKAPYEAALKKANETGEWSPILDTVGDRNVNWQVDAQKQFNDALSKVDAKLRTASAGPYRRPEVYPPVSFSNIDEVDLHFQAEQIANPNWTAHAVDYNKRPGKPAWQHPELFNDSGTGEQILPMSFLGIMRGADGIGTAGHIPHWGTLPADSRSGYTGTASVFRAINTFALEYGSWLTKLENSDLVAIPVSYRHIKVDNWGGVGGQYFTRLWEAYQSCLYARRPATFIFADDKPDLSRFKALLVVGQRFEPEPAFAELLAKAKKSGIAIFADSTCRNSLVKDFTQLGIAFDHIEKLHGFNNDVAYWDFAQAILANVPKLAAKLAPVIPSVAEIDQPEVLASERRSGDARFVWAVNNTRSPLDPGLLWRVQPAVATCLPVVAKVTLPLKKGEVVYDVFAGKEVSGMEVSGVRGQVSGKEGTDNGKHRTSNIQHPTSNEEGKAGTDNGKDQTSNPPRRKHPTSNAEIPTTDDRRLTTAISFEADLRYSQARLYAILPFKISGVKIDAPKQIKPGEKVEWNVGVVGTGKDFKAALPARVRLLDGDGRTLEQQFTVTGSGNLTVPSNAKPPFTLEATELISGQMTKTENSEHRTSNIERPTLNSKASGLSTDNRHPTPDTFFGPRIRDIAISRDGATALLNSFDWGRNLFALDLKTGEVKWTGNVGDQFAYSPDALGDGFVVQGYDLKSGEGYHLYMLDRNGMQQRRFALPGLPSRLTHWAFSAHLNDRINNFAVSPDGSWIAGAGNLGLAVWDGKGELLCSQDWSKESRQKMNLVALDTKTLLASREMRLSALDPKTGKAKWELNLAPNGKILSVAASTDGKTVAASTDTQGGRVFVVRDGKMLSTLPAPADELSLAPDGSWIAITKDNQVESYSAEGVLLWVFSGDGALHFPHAAQDGKRLAVASELGTLYVLDIPAGRILLQRDMGAIPALAWLPDGNLLAATWMGTAVRLASDGKEIWRANLADSAAQAKNASSKAALTSIPTIKTSSWSNAELKPLPLTPNLINPKKVLVTSTMGDKPAKLQNDAAILFDGQATAPEKPWVSWEDIGMIDSGWRGSFSLVIDTAPTQLRVKAITFVEDPAHPESWMRDAKLEYWDPSDETWVFSHYLTSDAAIHTHKLAKPVEAAKFRVTRPDGAGWPASNLRLAEIVLHGETLGGSHPDVAANRPVAVLFDEARSDLQCLERGPRGPFEFRSGPAASGALFMALKAEGSTCSAVPNWDFEIVEKPEKPGQYRWIQFAYKTLTPETRGVSIRVGTYANQGAIAINMGEPASQEKHLVWAQRQMADKPAMEWTVLRLDLWQVLQEGVKGNPWSKGPFRITSISLYTVGGGAAFDQILLGRSEKDLKSVQPLKP